MDHDAEMRCLKMAKLLRTNKKLKTSEGVMAEKRVDVFKGSLATNVLMDSKVVDDADHAHKILQEMIDAGLILRVLSVNNTRFLQPDVNRQWSDSAFFAWTYEGSQFWTLIGALGLLVLGLCIVMYPLWPRSLRNITWYLMVLVISFFVFLLIVSVIRLIVFVITFLFYKPGIWLFPNLYEDMSIIDSFFPLWAWHEPKEE